MPRWPPRGRRRMRLRPRAMRERAHRDETQIPPSETVQHVHRQQQVFKFAQRVGANDVDNVVPDKRTHRAFAGKHVKVVEPELGHAREQGVLHGRVAARHDSPGACALLHFAAKVCCIASVADCVGLVGRGRGVFCIFSCFALGFEVTGNVVERLVKTCQFSGDIGYTLAACVGGINLLHGPGFGISLSGLCCCCGRPVAESGSGAPGG